MKANLRRFASSKRLVLRLEPETEAEVAYLKRAQRIGAVCWDGSWWAGKRLTTMDFHTHTAQHHDRQPQRKDKAKR